MTFPDRATVEELRRTYPEGCRIVLDTMDDPYTKIPVGMQGTCTGVDDAGNILCAWDMGSSLSVAYGADSCHKISTEAEAKETLDWYGEHQSEKEAVCPRCGEIMPGALYRHALSRWASIIVCDRCGTIEAFEQAGLTEKKPLMKWNAIDGPQSGDGRWRG